MEHIEEAGVHSGDSACSLPPFSLSEDIKAELREQTRKMALALDVIGLMNVQFAIKGDDIYVLEVNPRASRTVPFVSKATSRPLAKVAALCMSGKSLAEQGVDSEIIPDYYSVKEAVFPFVKFPGVDTLLGPEMKSTGEVMGVGKSFGEAYNKAQQGTGSNIRIPVQCCSVCVIPTNRLLLSWPNIWPERVLRSSPRAARPARLKMPGLPPEP